MVDDLTVGVKVDGSKTAWSGMEWISGRWRECDGERRSVRLADDRVVPCVSEYKHLGTWVTAAFEHEEGAGAAGLEVSRAARGASATRGAECGAV